MPFSSCSFSHAQLSPSVSELSVPPGCGSGLPTSPSWSVGLEDATRTQHLPPQLLQPGAVVEKPRR